MLWCGVFVCFICIFLLKLVLNWLRFQKCHLAFMKKPNTAPWQMDKKLYPHDQPLKGKIKFLLQYAVLAPSTHNSQPWLFEIKGSSCLIYFDRSLRLLEADPKERDLYISLGCCLENLTLAAKYFGMFDKVEYHLKENLVAEVFLHDSTGIRNEDEYIISAISKRMNARGIFEPRAVGPALIEQIRSILVEEYGFQPPIETLFCQNKDDISRLASLTAQGLMLAHGKPSFRKEMSQWIHHNLSRKRHGMPGYALRMPLVLSFIIPPAIHFFNLGKLLAKLNYKSFSSAPLVCGFFCSEESPRVWIATGRMAERLMLEFQSRGLQTSIFVASVEMGDLYKKVQEVFRTSLRPQFLLCIGHMAATQPKTPKYSVDAKLIQ